MPALVLDRDARVQGAWSRIGNGDIHVYVDNFNKTVVIGQNLDYNDEIEYSDLALVVEKGKYDDGSVSLQYVGKDKEAVHAKVPEAVWRAEILDMLERLRKRVVVKQKEEAEVE